MSEINYNMNVNVSKFEWRVIEELRKLQAHGYGDFALKYADHICVDFRSAWILYSRKDLEALQT